MIVSPLTLSECKRAAYQENYMSLPEIIVSLVGLATLLLFVGSGAVWVWGFLNLHSGKPVLPKRFRSDLAPVPPLAAVLTLAYIAMTLWDRLRQTRPNGKFDAERIVESINASIVGNLTFGVILILILATMSQRWTDLCRLGFRSDDKVGQLRDGFLGFLGSLPPVFAVMWLTQRYRSAETTHPFLRLLEERGLGTEFAGIVVAAVIVGPLLEELMFRVILQSWLVRWVGVTPAIVGTAVIFAAVHGFPNSLGLLPLALILGVVYHRRRSFISIVIIHALFNAFNLGMTLFISYVQQVLPTDAL